jgi:hypothetical protein
MKALAALAKKLAQAGKNIDDLSPEEVQKILKNTADTVPPSPIGQGKNLDALMEAKRNAPDLEAPAGYPKNIVQDDLATPPAPMTKDFTMVPEGTSVPALIPEVVEEAPSMLPALRTSQKSLPSGLPSVIQGELSDEVKKRMDPRLAKLLGLGGVAGAAMFGMGGEEKQAPIPLAPEPKPAPEVAPVGEQVENAPKPIAPQQRAAGVEVAEQVQQAMPQESGQGDFRSLMDAAVNRAEKERDNANLLRAGENIAAGFMFGKADNSGSERLRKDADRFLGQASNKIDASKQDQSYKKLEKEFQDEEKLRDPNSDASKMTKQILARYGLNVRTAKEAKDAGINVQNILLQEMAAQKAKELASMKSTGEKGDKKFIRDLRKEATSGVLGKQYATFSTSQRMSSALSEFQKDPSGYKDYATLMGGLKSLQGDESVVREAEVRMGMSATSLFDSLQNQLQKAATGKLLQPEQRKQMVDTIRILSDISKNQYKLFLN